MFLNNLLRRTMNASSDKSWIEQLRPIIKDFKEGNNEPLRPEEVERLSLIIRFKIDFEEGNINEEGMEESGEWGGSEKGPQYSHRDYGEATSQDIKDATKYERERYGAREFKGGSPLYPGKGSTIVKSEGLLDQLKKKFGKELNNTGILNENSLLDDEDNE